MTHAWQMSWEKKAIGISLLRAIDMTPPFIKKIKICSFSTFTLDRQRQALFYVYFDLNISQRRTIELT